MSAPTFVSVTATSFTGTTSPVTTANISVNNGDVLVATVITDSGQASSLTISTASGSTSAWTSQVELGLGQSAEAYLRTWTSTATATGTITVSFTNPNAAEDFGGYVKVWRNSNGIGAVSSNTNGIGSGTPTVSLTSTKGNSGLDFGSGDFNGTTGTITFTSTNGSLVQDVGSQVAGVYSAYSAHVVDAGAIGSQTFGMSAPTAQRYNCSLIEILGPLVSVTPGILGLAECEW